ncbi:hypothetical protein TWF694_009064 [Orbilia ellipsospora]|uniref:Uncharacterized protein n=1 Tax=Orbilia ellipsospora TaxID=2528407 RepID=A0AAV9XDR5_9PEZI
MDAREIFNLVNQFSPAQITNVTANPINPIPDLSAAANNAFEALVVWLLFQVFCTFYLGPLVNRVLTALGFGALGTLFNIWITFYHGSFGLILRYILVPFLYGSGLVNKKDGDTATWALIFGAIVWIGRTGWLNDLLWRRWRSTREL